MPGRLADLWLMPHRPLFLAAGLWAIGASLWWRWGAPPASAFWHGHEMLAGFGGAALAGYLLTALASWTGRPAPAGRVLQAILGCWLVQRLAMGCGDALPPVLAILPGLGFFGLMAAVMAHGMRHTGQGARPGLVLAVAAMGLADALAILAARTTGWHGPDGSALLELMLLGFALLIAGIGGRMVPAFTGNWLRASGRAVAAPASAPRTGRLGLLSLGAAPVLMLAGADAASGAALLLAALAQLWRLAGWRGRHVLANPLLVMLHAAFLWLPLGLGLVGLQRLGLIPLPASDLLHALAMGAMGGMILAVAARAAARRHKGQLRAGPALCAAAMALWLAPWLRLAPALWPGAREGLLDAATLAWALGWALFVLALWPGLRGPAHQPVFSGSRA